MLDASGAFSLLIPTPYSERVKFAVSDAKSVAISCRRMTGSVFV